MIVEQTGYKTLKQLEDQLDRLERFEKLCLWFGTEGLYLRVNLKIDEVREELFTRYSKEIVL